MTKRTCHYCFKAFKPEHSEHQKFCSKECYDAYAKVYGFKKAGFNDFTNPSHAEVSMDPLCSENFVNFKNAIVIQAVNDACEHFRHLMQRCTKTHSECTKCPSAKRTKCRFNSFSDCSGKTSAGMAYTRVINEIRSGGVDIYTELPKEVIYRAIVIKAADEFASSYVHSVTNLINRNNKELAKIQKKITEKELSLHPSGIAYDGDKVDNSPSDRMADVMAEIDDLSRKHSDIKKITDEAKKELMWLIRHAPDYIQQWAHRVYVIGETRRKVCDDMQLEVYATHDKMIAVACEQYSKDKHLAEISAELMDAALD